MKKHISLFMLFVRCSLPKALLVYLLTAAGHTAVYFVKSSQWQSSQLFAEGPWAFVTAAGLLLMAAVLVSGAAGGKGRPVYTLARLEGGLPRAYLWQFAANALMLFLFWWVNALTLFGLHSLFLGSLPRDTLGPQTLLLRLYDDPFLHALLPQEDISLWLRNAALILALSAVMAGSSCRRRIGRGGFFGLGFMLSLAVLSFRIDMGEWQFNAFMSAFYLLVTAGSMGMNMSGKGVREDEYEEEESAA